ncbi:hypothetical protein [Nocardioides albus]|uniref:Uncharacterized protein n=1 Tax=Nocardioides albus TaxID=1841 RepID=A0A7W5A676_9ACTN|nr:hypothetical protein [Nocardioides albus]MBB3090210.1 hypothetical protein [Nocardioides albus]GGU28515.1 hypothetical protein GCM10007979_29180 [Nocardioides albus]
MLRRGTALLAAALLLAGCGSSATEADDGAAEKPSPTPSVSIDPADLKPGDLPATPEALAAITLQHAPVKPEGFDGGDRYFEHDEVGTVLLWGDRSLEVKAGAVDDDLLSTWCRDGMSGCVEVKTESGTATVAWDLATGDGTPGQVMVSHEADGEERRAAYLGEKITEDPRKLDLEVDVDDLVALVTDPRLGTKTTAKMTKAQVSGFPSAGANDADGAGEVALTAGAIAAGLLEIEAYADIDSFVKADASSYGKGAFGVVGTGPDGSTVTAVHAPNLPAAQRKCPKTLTCSKGDTDGYDGWTEGSAETVRCHEAEGERDAFCAVVREKAPAPFPEDDLDPVLSGLEAALETLWPTASAESVRRGESLVA